MSPPKRTSKSEPKSSLSKTVQKNETNTKVDDKPAESPVDNTSDKTDDTAISSTLEKPLEPTSHVEPSNVTPTNHRFKAGEIVLCFHGPLIYEAKCHNVRTNDLGMSEYFIHYNGWNKTWDEWVPECRVLKFNESNVQRQKDLKKSQQESDQSSKKKKKFDGKDSEGRCVTPTLDKICKIKAMGGVSKAPSVASSQDSGSDVPKRKKARIDNSVETMEEYLNKVEIKIKIPDSLRTWLVDDWDTINNKNKLHQIPAKTSVDEIFESYLKHKANSKQMSGAKGKTVTEMVAGLKEYFNVMLGSQLLYQAERRQYSQVMQKYQGAPLSSLYGASHLLRLFVRIGSVLAYTGLTERNIQLLQNAFQDFLWYLLQQATTLNHCSHYMDIPSDLIQRSSSATLN
ncbi:hypothetical protein M8J75_013352 [Diaphorina citri]|nr:hypothetical protein M8J75_013352 [Diaphorina citri]